MNNENMIYEINNKKYFIDVKNYSFNLLENPKQQLSIYDMWHREYGYQFHFDLSTNKIVLHEKDFNPDTCDLLNIPHLSSLVPNAIAKHYGLQTKEVINKTDYEIMLDKRDFFDFKQFQLPLVEIEGQYFVVRVLSNRLSPTNKREGSDINFYDLDSFFNEKLNQFIFPYNPATQRLEKFDLRKTTEIPAHLVLISIPHYDKLDPIRNAIKRGVSLSQILPKAQLKGKIIAKKIPWEKTDFPELFKENIERLAKDQKEVTKTRRTKKM